jgi:hypothetical protein
MTVFDKIAMVVGYLSLMTVVCIFLGGLLHNAVDWFWADRCPKCGARLKNKE